MTLIRKALDVQGRSCCLLDRQTSEQINCKLLAFGALYVRNQDATISEGFEIKFMAKLKDFFSVLCRRIYCTWVCLEGALEWWWKFKERKIDEEEKERSLPMDSPISFRIDWELLEDATNEKKKQRNTRELHFADVSFRMCRGRCPSELILPLDNSSSSTNKSQSCLTRN